MNMELKMGTGKIGAQCAHAACGVVTYYKSTIEPALRAWEACGTVKIALRVNDSQQLEELAKNAQALGLPFYQVYDAGRTQVAAGSATVLAIGPAPKSLVDQITGSLKLL